MYIYAGIDEAGYGPAFGPLTVGCSVIAVPKLAPDALSPDLWKRLNKAVCRNLSERRGRIAINDSKKLTTKAAGFGHLEVGCLAFAGLMGLHPTNAGAWLDAMGARCHRPRADRMVLPWYAETNNTPWPALPVAVDAGELAVARGLLRTTAGRIGVEVAGLGCDVISEDRFNTLVAATRSKAAVSFTAVTAHLQRIFEQHGEHRPTVVVDRQSGRMRYRDLLAMAFDRCTVSVERETPTRSSYTVEGTGRGMNVHFQAEAERQHLPVALASMLAKYNRELLMTRFKAWFAERLPDIAPTAGYGSDAKRFWQQVRPHLPRLGIDPALLRRVQ